MTGYLGSCFSGDTVFVIIARMARSYRYFEIAVCHLQERAMPAISTDIKPGCK